MLWSSVAARQTDWPQLKFTQIANVARPTSIADPGDGSGRLFVTDQSGLVMAVQSNSVTTFLNIQDLVDYVPGRDHGLLSVVFPPDFATRQYFYTFYNPAAGASTVSRFFVSSTNANIADESTEQVLISLPPPGIQFLTLSGGDLVFGPDGYLYVGMGDSGFALNLTNEAQNTHAYHGKILRIDVESSTNQYRVPTDNPFVGNPNYLPEIWALGLRNPWRFSFDRATGDCYIGDVGAVEAEEVDFKSAGSPAGLNYGWPILEGNHLYAGPDQPLQTLTAPIAEYLHTTSISAITGGYVYRGPNGGRMTGLYFYADAYSGRLWAMGRDGTNWVSQLVAKVPYFTTTFGEDHSGQLYLADFASGNIYRVEDTGAVAAPTFTPPGTNSATEAITVSSISPNVTIRYTTNGVDPVASDPGVSSGGAITITSGTTLKAIAFRNDLLPSPVTAVPYTLKVGRPAFTPGMARYERTTNRRFVYNIRGSDLLHPGWN